jgi:uncharacterized protein (TIGR02996 family)
MNAAELALITEIEAAPRRLDRRLIYADWLEERADPRSEFIHVCHEMESLKPWEECYVELFRTRQKLRADIDPGWLRRLNYFDQHSPMFTELPPDRPSRWRLLTLFLELWYRPVKDTDRVSERVVDSTERRLGLDIPAALKEWYRQFGYYAMFMNCGRCVLPHDLTLSRKPDGVSFFQNSNYHFSIFVRRSDLGMDDPPVCRFYSFGVSDPAPEYRSLSEFLIYECLAAVIYTDSPTHGWKSQPAMPATHYVSSDYSPVAIRKTGLGPLPQLWEGPDTLIETFEGSVGGTLNMASLDLVTVRPILEQLSGSIRQVREGGTWTQIPDERRFVEGVSDFEIDG